MKEIEIQTFAALYKIIETYDSSPVIYRGMKLVKFLLIPKAVRLVPPRSIRSRTANENEILSLFKERALRFLGFIPVTD